MAYFKVPRGENQGLEPSCLLIGVDSAIRWVKEPKDKSIGTSKSTESDSDYVVEHSVLKYLDFQKKA